jgi:hypothetical protein
MLSCRNSSQVSSAEPITARYVRFGFGDHSADWGAAGSGIYRLHVMQVR